MEEEMKAKRMRFFYERFVLARASVVAELDINEAIEQAKIAYQEIEAKVQE